MSDLLQQGEQLMRMLDDALAEYKTHNIAEADAEFELSRGEANVIYELAKEEKESGEKRTVQEKNAIATMRTEAEKEKYLVARANRQVAQKALDSYQSQLSFIQTAMKQQQIEYSNTMAKRANDF